MDIRVRKAISHAIDRKALVVGIAEGLAVEASCMYPKYHWCHNPNLEVVKYDPELSRKLLAEAGFSKGLTVKGYYGSTSGSVSMAEAIMAMLEKVGVKWEVEFLDSAAQSDKIKNREYDLGGGGWVSITDPDIMATGLFMPEGGFNYGRSNNKAAQELILAGRSEVDVEKRKQIYWKLEETLYNNYENVWLWWPKGISAYQKNVMGVNVDRIKLAGNSFYATHPFWFKDGKQ